ncbi:MAG TPA: hypothetical protein VG895_03010 [Patescibacteria group bacterium]|nr:hypothetical protein [Patescibacteria group bacterium]
MKKVCFYLLLILGLHLIILNLLQFTAWPEMISFPYFLNHGFINYSDMVHAYPPLLVVLLSVVYKIFGYKLIALEIFGWIGFLVNDFLIFLILKKLTKKEYLAVCGVLVYVFLQPILEGNMVWPDLFMSPFLLGGFLLFLNKRFFLTGLILVLAVLTKQTGIFYLGIVGFCLLFKKDVKNIFKYIFGITIIILPFLFSLIMQTSLKDFINWTIIYPSKYWTKFPGYVQLLPTAREGILLFILIISILLILTKSFKQVKRKKEFYLLSSFFLAGIIGFYPRFSFFHLQPAIAFFVILIIYLSSKINFNYYLLFLIPILVLIINIRSLQFRGSRFWSSDEILAKTVQRDSLQNKPIYLLGLNSDIYAFSDRFPNKPWLDNFGWYLEIPGVQESVIKSFNTNKPSAIFWAAPQNGNWYDIGTYQPKMITDWIKENYVYTKNISEGVQEWKLKK